MTAPQKIMAATLLGAVTLWITGALMFLMMETNKVKTKHKLKNRKLCVTLFKAQHSSAHSRCVLLLSAVILGLCCHSVTAIANTLEHNAQATWLASQRS